MIFNAHSLRMSLVVFDKELKDALRDTRAMKLAWMPVLYFVGIFLASFFFMLNLQKGETVAGIKNISVPVYGMENYPALQQWLEEHGAIITPVTKTIYDDITTGSAEFALVIPDNVIEDKAAAKSVTLTLLYDASNQGVHQKLNFVRGTIHAFNARESAVNLLARGVATDVAVPIRLVENNLASEQRMGIYVLGSVPMMLILSVFIVGIGFSADMTAGERERRSLEALLITPVSAGSLIFGKWLTSLLITWVVVSVVVISLGVSMAFLPFNELGVRVDSDTTGWLIIWLSLLPLMVLAVALQIVISLFAKSFKDAQTYTSLMIFIPMAATFYLLFNPSAFYSWFYWVPVLGQQVVVRDVLLGENFSVFALIKLWLVDCFLAWLCLLLAAKKIRTRSIIYG